MLFSRIVLPAVLLALGEARLASRQIEEDNPVAIRNSFIIEYAPVSHVS